MEVICVKDTKRLIKGNVYQVVQIWNSGIGQIWRKGSIVIFGISGSYTVNNFITMSGKKMPKIDYKDPLFIKERTFLKYKELSVGDILVCVNNRYKTFIKNGKYKIESLEIVVKKRTGYNGIVHDNTAKKIKFVGIKRRVDFNPWCFRKLTNDEIRQRSLNSILDTPDDDLITSESINKLDLIKDKDDILLKTLAKSIIDEYRHKISIIDWACVKIGNKLDLKKEDYEPYLDITLRELLKKIK